MIRTFTMTWNEMRIDHLNPWVYDQWTDMDYAWVTKAFGRWTSPEVMFKAADNNSAPIYIAEHTWAWASEQYPLYPWKTLTLDYSYYVQAMNIFYVTWQSNDLLSVICR